MTTSSICRQYLRANVTDLTSQARTCIFFRLHAVQVRGYTGVHRSVNVIFGERKINLPGVGRIYIVHVPTGVDCLNYSTVNPGPVGSDSAPT